MCLFSMTLTNLFYHYLEIIAEVPILKQKLSETQQQTSSDWSVPYRNIDSLWQHFCVL